MVYNNFYGGRALSIAIGLTMLGLLLAGGAEAATLTVCSSSCTYSSIQAAINAASSGDILIVDSGTYYENVNVNKQLTLRGIGMPVVNAGGSGSAIKLSVNGIILEGFTATGGDTGITVGSNSNKLSGNKASNNYYHGIYLSSSSDNTLNGNNASNDGNGIYLSSSSNNTLNGNNVSNDGNGIYLSSSSNNTLNGNNASNDDTGIYLSSSSNNTLNGNNASNDDTGIYLSSSSNNTLNGNNVSNDGNGIYLSSSSNNMLNGNNASNDGNGIYLSSSSNNTLNGNNASKNNYGFYLSLSHYNELSSNTLNSNNYGIYIISSIKNNISNNIFNNTNNAYTDTPNNWNTTKKAGTNIIGGSYLGGNFWANPKGTGFSQTCTDSNGDGSCDSPYTLATDNVDYLPLAYSTTLTPTPTPSMTGVTISPTTPFAGNEINLTIGINNPGASFTGRVEGNIWPPSGTGKYLGWEDVVIPSGVSTVTIIGPAGGERSSYITHEQGPHYYDVFLENVDNGEDYRNATDSRLGVAFTVGTAASVYMSNIVLSASPTNGSVMTLNVTIFNPTSSAFAGTMNANIWDSVRGYALTPKSISIAAGSSTTLTFSYTPVNHGLHSYDFFMVSDVSGQNTKAPWGFACLDYLAGVGFTVG